jgi:quinol monooxygenase YgiN
MADEPVTVVARIRAKPGMDSQVLEELLKVVVPTRAEAGCINYDLHQAADDPCLFLFHENWVHKQALDEHLQKPYLKTLIENTSEMLAEPIEISLWKMIGSPK